MNNCPPASPSLDDRDETPIIGPLPILIVDDEPDVLKALTRTLRAQNWQVVTASGPHEALELLENQEFSAAVSDYRMPGMDGVEFLAQVRTLWPDCERILLTACADEEALERGINDAGVHRLLRKPWRAKVLISVLGEALHQSRLRREHAVLIERVRHRNQELSYLNRLLSDRVAESDRAILSFRRRWDTALNAISDPIVIVNNELVIEGANAAGGALARTTTDAMEGHKCYKLIFGNKIRCAGCPLKVGSGRIVQVREGRERLFDARAYPLPPAASAHICVYRDITQKVAFEQEASHMEKMAAIGRLAGGVAHELNNPLHAILTFVQLAQKPEVAEQKLTRYHEVIRESAMRCRDIVQSLRSFSRRDAASERRIVNLNQICDKATVLFEAITKIRIERAEGPAEPLCFANANQCQQVLINFLQNAVDASPQGGLIRMAIEEEASEWVLSVEDQGPGIPKEERAKILEPFYTTKPEGVGTGLGLAISHKILHDHGGSLRVSSASLGGARFEARLPRLTERQRAEAHDA